MLKFMTKRLIWQWNIFDFIAMVIVVVAIHFFDWSAGGIFFWICTSYITTMMTSCRLEKTAGHDYKSIS